MDDQLVYLNLSEEDRQKVRKCLLKMRLLWMGCIGSVPVLLILVIFLKDVIQPQEEFPLQIVRTILIVISAVVLPLSFILRKYFFTSAIENPGKKLLFQQPGGQSELFSKYIAIIYVPIALACMPAYFGFILWFIGQDYVMLYILAAAAFICAFMHRPKEEEVTQLLNAMNRSNDPA